MDKFWFTNQDLLGDYRYGKTHIIFLILLFGILILIFLLNKIFSNKINLKIIKGIGIFGILFEVFWRIIYLTLYKGGIESIYPFYACNLGGLLVPIICLLNSENKHVKRIKEMFYIFALLGGIVTFIMPERVFENPHLTFPILKSLIQHSYIIIIPLYELLTKRFKPSIKKIHYVFYGMIVHLLNSELMPIAFGQKDFDYLYLRSGLPFTLNKIPLWFPPIFTAVVLIFLTYVLIDNKTVVEKYNEHKNKIILRKQLLNDQKNIKL